MKKITFWSVVISAITLFSACTLYLDEPELEETNRKGFDEPVHETTDKYDVTYQFNEGVHYLQQENVDDYILMCDDTIVYYAENTPSELLPHKGEVIYSGFCNMFPEGFAHEVVDVEKENGMYKLTCKLSNFDKVFKELDLTVNIVANPNDPNLASEEDDAVNQVKTRSSDIRNDLQDAKVYKETLDLSFTLDATKFQDLKKIYNRPMLESEARERDPNKKKFGVSYDGNLQFSFGYSMEKSFLLHFNKGKRQFYYKMTDVITKSFGIAGEGSVAFRVKASDLQPEGGKKFFGEQHLFLHMMAGPVPLDLYIKPEIEFAGGVKGSIYGTFSQTNTSSTGFYYNSQSDKGPLETPKSSEPWVMKEKEGTVGIQAGLFANLNVNLEVGLTVAKGLIDGYVKPYAELDAGLNFDINNNLGNISKPNNTFFGASFSVGFNAGLAINVPMVNAELFRVEAELKSWPVFDLKYSLYPSVESMTVIEDKSVYNYQPDFPIFNCDVEYKDGWVDVTKPRIDVYAVPDDDAGSPKYVASFEPYDIEDHIVGTTYHFQLTASQSEIALNQGIKRGNPYLARFIVTRKNKDYLIGEQYFSTRAPKMQLSSYRQLYGGPYVNRGAVAFDSMYQGQYEYRFRVECLLHAASKMYNAGYHIDVRDEYGDPVLSKDVPLFASYPFVNKNGKVEKWNNVRDGIRTMEVILFSKEEGNFQVNIYPIVYLLKEDGSYSKKEYPNNGVSWSILESNIDKRNSEPNRADIVQQF